MNIKHMPAGLNHIYDADKIHDGMVIVDAGASRGEFATAVKCIRGLRDFHLYGLEPADGNYMFLRDRIYPGQLLKAALVGQLPESGQVQFMEYIGKNGKYHQWSNCCNLYEKQAKTRNDLLNIKKYEVNAMTLTHLVDLCNIKTLNYLKMDIEGSEEGVIMEMDQDIADRIDQISFEYHLKNCQPLLDKLKGLGFNLILKKGAEIYASRSK